MNRICKLLLGGVFAAALSLSARAADNTVDFQKIFNEANAVYKAGKWQEALPLLHKAGEAANSEWRKYAVNYRLAYCYYNSRQNEKALEFAAEALKYSKIDDRDRNRFINVTAEALMRLKRYEEALKVIDKRLAENTVKNDMYYTMLLNKGVILYELKKYKESLDNLLKLQECTKVDKSVSNKGNWYTGAAAMALGDKATAVKYFEIVAQKGQGWFAKSAKKNLQKLQAR